MIPKGGLKVGMKVRGEFNDDGALWHYEGVVDEIYERGMGAWIRVKKCSWTGIKEWRGVNDKLYIKYSYPRKLWGADKDAGELFVVNDRMQKLKERLMT